MAFDRTPSGGRAEPVCTLHIGPHKTGTTSIQHYLARNAGWLATRGVAYPVLDRAGSAISHHGALTRLKGFSARRPIPGDHPAWSPVAAIADEGRRDIVLSSEFLARRFLKARRLDAVLGFFRSRGYRVRVLAYVRDQPGWLNSWYVQTQKRLIAPMSFEAFAADAAVRGLVDPSVFLGSLADDPRLTLDVASLEQASAAGIERDFLRRIGVDPDGAPAPLGRENRNAGAKTVYAAQEIMRRAGGDIRAMAEYDAIYARFRKRFRRLGWDAEPYVGYDAAGYAAIRARYAETNERLAARWFGRPWAEIAPERVQPPRVFDPATARAAERAEVEAVIAEVVAMVAEARSTRPAEAATGAV